MVRVSHRRCRLVSPCLFCLHWHATCVHLLPPPPPYSSPIIIPAAAAADIDAAIETYNLMSQRFFTHATPTLFNAGTPRPQLSSCFLLAMKDDSIDGEWWS